MIKLAIVHFSPLELYPPVMNWLNYLSEFENGIQVQVFTMHAGPEFKSFLPKSPSVVINRKGRLGKNQFPFTRYAHYLLFYVNAALRILSWKPNSVLYYETLSAWPALLYKQIRKEKCCLLVHYHEYISPSEYEKGMFLNRWQHRIEKKGYRQMKWISHTNADRMRFFKADNDLGEAENTYILPNYPPLSWLKNEPREKINNPVRFVYVGALSLETMFVAEFAKWIIDQQGKTYWDIYSANMNDQVKSYLLSFASPYIRLKGSVDYFSLPAVLADYDVGVILYKVPVMNYIYNAPNKLFEYFGCGLDTWFPEHMTGSHPYITTGSYPSIIAVDFENLQMISAKTLTDHSADSFKASGFYCEDVLKALLYNGIGYEDAAR